MIGESPGLPCRYTSTPLLMLLTSLVTDPLPSTEEPITSSRPLFSNKQKICFRNNLPTFPISDVKTDEKMSPSPPPRCC